MKAEVASAARRRRPWRSRTLNYGEIIGACSIASGCQPQRWALHKHIENTEQRRYWYCFENAV